MKENHERRRVVLVDDEAGLLQLFHDILSMSYQVVPFSSPEQFIKFLEGHKKPPFEILITDLKMPGMTGIEMIRSAQSKGFFFPSVLLSGYLDKNAVVEAVDLGVYRLLEKPTSPDLIISAIDELLVEYDIRDVRGEIRDIHEKLKEYYNFLRLLVASKVPESEMNEFAIHTTETGHVITQETCDELLNRLEGRLDKLLRSENVLEQMRAKRYKNIA